MTLHRNLKAVRRETAKHQVRRAIHTGDKYLSDGTPVERSKNVGGQRAKEQAIAKRLRGGDRRATNVQCRAAQYSDSDIVGSGKLGTGVGIRTALSHRAS